MQPLRYPPHVVALLVTATLLLFVVGIAVSVLATRGSHPVTPFAPFTPHAA